ncbi:hypothetical protein [Microbulbifer halophilus]|uniref:Acyl carrier protein n=1 Tax=Microbulbifer halophilus TaxID=453963 RepID=A0ABW5EBL8_9GAMM|nr:hypothetical protein [Microbulbifer halophilus]MCW8125767.1 hypothetical protein [Microbulbifer halophilus]
MSLDTDKSRALRVEISERVAFFTESLGVDSGDVIFSGTVKDGMIEIVAAVAFLDLEETARVAVPRSCSEKFVAALVEALRADFAGTTQTH